MASRALDPGAVRSAMLGSSAPQLVKGIAAPRLVALCRKTA